MVHEQGFFNVTHSADFNSTSVNTASSLSVLLLDPNEALALSKNDTLPPLLTADISIDKKALAAADSASASQSSAQPPSNSSMFGLANLTIRLLDLVRPNGTTPAAFNAEISFGGKVLLVHEQSVYNSVAANSNSTSVGNFSFLRVLLLDPADNASTPLLTATISFNSKAVAQALGDKGNSDKFSSSTSTEVNSSGGPNATVRFLSVRLLDPTEALATWAPPNGTTSASYTAEMSFDGKAWRHLSLEAPTSTFVDFPVIAGREFQVRVTPEGGAPATESFTQQKKKTGKAGKKA